MMTKTPFRSILFLVVLLLGIGCDNVPQGQTLRSSPEGANQALQLTQDSEAKNPFDRVLLLAGGGTRTAIFLGMLAALEDELQWKPDLIISTCGASLAAIVAAEFNTTDERRQFIESREYYEVLRAFRTRDVSLSLLDKIRARAKITENRGKITFPNEDENVFEVDYSESMSSIFGQFREGHQKVAIGGSQLFFDPRENSSHYLIDEAFSEAYFVDPETLKILSSMRWPFESSLKHSGSPVPVSGYVRFFSQYSRGVAARASISDPYAVFPAQTDDHRWFGGGALNLVPTELALQLGKQVVATHNGPYDELERNVLKSSWGFDFARRLGVAHSQPIWRWIDFSNASEFKDMETDPEFSIISSGVVSRLPDEFGEQFLKMVRLQWQWGYRRAIESFEVPPGSYFHIRRMDKSNSTPERLRLWKEAQKKRGK